MTEDQKQARLAEIRKAPKPVQYSVTIAFAIGIIALIRMPLAAYTTHLSVGRAIFWGFLMLFWFISCGASLYNRNRWGHVGLAVIALLPCVGLGAYTLHLFLMGFDGTLSSNWAATIHCLIAALQLLATIVLLRYLLAQQTRDFVWKKVSPPTIPATT